MLETREITKDFGGTRALDRVSFSARAGEVHALVGKNGAGKSTLMKIISGALKPDSGAVCMRGHVVRVDNPQQALRSGISIVHQHSSLVPDLTVAENIFLGRMPKNRLGLVRWKQLYSDAIGLLEHLGFSLDEHRRAGDLDVASQQVTEIARALSVSAQVLIMDEPSAVLGPSELGKLFRIIRKLKSQGKTVIYVSHRLEEIFQISDRVTVLRDGKIVGTYSLDNQVHPSFFIRKMVGKDWVERSLKLPKATGSELLRIQNLTREGAFENISFKVHAGEILGFAGLIGSGRTELCKAIFGARTYDKGRIYVDGNPVQIHSPDDALKQKIAYLSKDRHKESLILCQPIGENITMSILDRFTSRGILKLKKESQFIDEVIGKMGIRPRGRRQLAGTLSGGNQQKVALAKWLSTQAKIFLLDEPTAGVDVGAKSQIHQLVVDLAKRGSAILLVSSDIPEILSLCNRIIVMSKGRVTGHLQSKVVKEEDVLQLAM